MYKTKSAEDTFRLGCALGRFLTAGDTVLLYGELGSGKSVLARGCAKALGVDESMASPTFTLMQPYKGTDYTVYHFDLYRLSGADELFYSGLEENIGGDGVALIEWPQQGDVCPDTRIEIDFLRGEESDERLIDVAVIGCGDREKRILDALSPWRA